jgi:uroporphyrinogen-III synthase
MSERTASLDVSRPGRATWLFTRELADAMPDCAALEAKGVRAVAVPCIECVELAWPQWSPAPGEPLVFLTSRRAARVFARPRAGSEALIAAVSPTTSGYVTRQGRTPAIVVPGGAVALAHEVVRAWEARGQPVWHVRYPTSDVGLEAPEQLDAVRALERVGPVERRVVYETRTPEGLAGRLAPWLETSFGLCFASPSAVSACLQALPPAPPPPMRVLCFGRSTWERYQSSCPAGWPPGALVNSLVDAILSLPRSTP